MPSVIAAGTTAGSAISVTGDTTGNLAFQTNGTTTAMTITTSQNVGIGTSSPTYSLTIGDSTAPTGITLLNSLISTDTATGQNLLIRKSNTSASGVGLGLAKSRGTAASPTAVASGDTLAAINFYGYGGTNYRPLSQVFSAVDTYTSDTDISSYLVFGTSPSGAASTVERMRITSGGSVGIGTTAPSNKLDVTGATSTYIAVSSTNASTGSGLYTTNATRTYLIGAGAASGNSNLEFRDVTGSATRMSLDTSGNLGIGVIPSYRLDVSGASVVANINSTNNNNVLAISNASTLGGYIGATGTNLLFANNAGTEAMRINSSANVTIGTTSASARLTVNSTGTTIGLWTSSVNNHGIYGEATGTGYGVYGRAYNSGYGGCIGFDASNTVYGIIGYTTYALQTNASINVNGTIYASDGRLKENVKPIDSALNKIAQLNPVSFDWKANSTRGIINKNTPLPDYGLIAQEVEQVLPDIVYETQSPSLPNNTPASQSLEAELGTYKGVDYSRLIPFLTKAIQELKAELDEAKAEIQALKGAQ